MTELDFGAFSTADLLLVGNYYSKAFWRRCRKPNLWNCYLFIYRTCWHCFTRLLQWESCWAEFRWKRRSHWPSTKYLALTWLAACFRPSPFSWAIEWSFGYCESIVCYFHWAVFDSTLSKAFLRVLRQLWPNPTIDGAGQVFFEDLFLLVSSLCWSAFRQDLSQFSILG